MLMRRKTRGFKLGKKIIGVFKCLPRMTRYKITSCKYSKLDNSTTQRNKAISKLCKWGRKIKQGLLNPGSSRGYIRVGYESRMDTKPVRVPKGHLAVYVGEPEGETQRVLVPVVFINHPLFEKLLKEAEDVYGFNHSGRITVPCPISEFESVKSRIAAAGTKCRQLIPSYFPAGLKCLST